MAEEKDMDKAVDQFKNTMDGLKKKNMYDQVVKKYEKEKKDKKKNPFEKKSP